jgi:predicted transposase YdaD
MAGAHDALFKSIFEQPEHAAALVRANLSETLSSSVDWSTKHPKRLESP